MFSRTVVYRYDTITNQTEKLNNLTFSFYSGSACTIGDNIYLFGGEKTTNAVYKYDINTDTFVKLGVAIPFAFKSGEIATIGTDVYLFGGAGTTSGSPNSKKAYKFNTETLEFTKLADAPVDFEYGDAIAVGTNVYVYLIDATVYLYDTLTNTYQTLDNVPVATTSNISIEKVGNNIYISPSGDSFYKYDTINKEYTALNDTLDNIVDSTIYFVKRINNKLYVFTESAKVYNYNFLEDKSVNIITGNGTYKSQIYENKDIAGRLLCVFDDVVYNTAESGIDNTLPTYYGTGTEWAKFKN